MFEKAMKNLKLKCNEVLIFEDSTAGIQAAENSNAQKIIIADLNKGDYSKWNYQKTVNFSEVDKSIFDK